MSNVEYYTTDMRWGMRAGSVKLHDRLERGRERSQPEARFGRISGMIETAENLAKQFGISRAQSMNTRCRANAVRRRLLRQVVSPRRWCPCWSHKKKGEAILVSRDEGVRAATTVQTLGALRPLLKDGTVTAGNSSQQNDAAAACLVVAEDKLAELNLEPLAFWSAGPPPGVNRPRWESGLFRRWRNYSAARASPSTNWPW